MRYIICCDYSDDEYVMKIGFVVLFEAVFVLLFLTACGKSSNPFNPALFKSSEAEYQTLTEEAAPAMAMPGQMQPFLPPIPLPGPAIPPPLLDPLTNGPVLPPPPPPFDDEGAVPRPLVVIPRCGDRRLEQITATADNSAGIPVTFPVFGEQCDDGNDFSGDGCSDICIEEFCGNGYIEVEHGEQCDGGVPADTFPQVCSVENPGCIAGKQRKPQAWNCDKFCRLIVCGDGVVQLGGVGPAPEGQTVKVAEQCDLGAKNGDCSGCTTSCTLQTPCTTNAGCTCPTK